MKNKRILAIGLTLILIICNGMTVWALDTWDEEYNLGYTDETNQTLEDDSADRISDGNGQKDVTANLGLTDPGETYSVDIAWGSFECTPEIETEKSGLETTWNDDTGEYDVANHTGEWTFEDGADKITITNRSNVNITATFEPLIDKANFVANYLAKDEATQGAAALNIADNSATIKSKLNLSGSESHIFTNTVSLESVTITRTKQVPVNSVTIGTVTVTISGS